MWQIESVKDHQVNIFKICDSHGFYYKDFVEILAKLYAPVYINFGLWGVICSLPRHIISWNFT